MDNTIIKPDYKTINKLNCTKWHFCRVGGDVTLYFKRSSD